MLIVCHNRETVPKTELTTGPYLICVIAIYKWIKCACVIWSDENLCLMAELSLWNLQAVQTRCAPKSYGQWKDKKNALSVVKGKKSISSYSISQSQRHSHWKCPSMKRKGKKRKVEEKKGEKKKKKIRRGKIAEMCKMYLNLCQAYQQNWPWIPSLKAETYIPTTGNYYKNDYEGIKHS